MTKLFGFSIEPSESKSKSEISPVPPNNGDGVDNFIASGFYGSYVDIEGAYRNEHELIKRYREMAIHPEVDNAIEDVVNEAIVSDLYDSPVEIELSNINASDKLKDLIRKEFRYIKELLDFDKKSHEIFRNWYVDGKIYYHKVIDLKKPEEGIKELRYIDPMKMKFVRQEKKVNKGVQGVDLSRTTETSKVLYPEIEEYFVYSPKPNFPVGMVSGAAGQKGIKMAKDTVTYVTSGLVDRNKGSILSYLHKAIKALNQLRMIEDSLVIYRLSRAPERRIFYIDVGNLPKVKAEQYLRDVMNRYRNKQVYNAQTGEIRDDRKFMSMMEDFWLPRREGGRGTEITTLPGGQNLGDIADIQYFQRKLYQSLNVPMSRLQGETGFTLGRASEITRDELKFNKFIQRVQRKFSQFMIDILRIQLIAKGVMTDEDFEDARCDIRVDFLEDNHFTELKNNELLQQRVGMLGQVEPYLGKFYSLEWARKNILMQSEEEMKEIDDQIEAEKEEQEAEQEPEGGNEVPDMDSMQTTDEPEDNEGEE